MAVNNETGYDGLLKSTRVIDNFINNTMIDTIRGFSDALAFYMCTINISGLAAFLCVLGIPSNIINAIIFKRHGFKDNVNITLFAIAISDMISLITALWLAICYNPLLTSATDLPFLPSEVQMLTGDVPHIMAFNATCWFTAFVTFERCLCISFPLKVKDIMTPRRTKAYIFFVIFMVIAFQIPTYYSVRLEWRLDEERNKSVLGLAFKEEVSFLYVFTYNLVTLSGPLLCFFIVIICSVILVIKLTQKGKWRQEATSGSGKEDMRKIKDRKVVKMVLVVALIYIICNTPAIVMSCYAINRPDFTPTGSLANNSVVSLSFAIFFETINGSINIVIYYHMSSKYKAMFLSIFFNKN